MQQHAPSGAYLTGADPDAVAGRIEQAGWCVIDEALPPALCAVLREECSDRMAEAFRPAGIGRNAQYQVHTAVRSDEICWLSGATEATAAYLAYMEHLRRTLNRSLFLGLFDYECHFARYAPGAFYATHRDAFADRRNRLLSTVLYLNPGWLPAYGGELVLYADDASTRIDSILPVHNRLVLFLSEQFPHEVRPATQTRYSLTGWFRAGTAQV